MATAAHCIACFEALDGHLNKRKPLSLEEIQAKWEAYAATTSEAPKPSTTLSSSLAVPDTSSSSATPGSSSSLSSGSLSIGASTPATSTSSLSLSTSRSPLFVTWNTYENDEDPEDEEVSLRGCIGTFENQELSSAVAEYAIISAIHDSRFSPISKRELPTLQAAVTLLTDFEAVADPYDWELGTHGVRLSFQDRGRRYGSTYLPDVASEQGWTKEETLYSLTRKAGWMGSRSKFQDLPLQVTRYQGSKAKMGYDEYRKWHSWADRN